MNDTEAASGGSGRAPPPRFCPECPWSGRTDAYYCPECGAAFFPSAVDGCELKPHGDRHVGATADQDGGRDD